MTWFLAARTFLGKVPREIWYALAVLLAVWWLRADAYSDGRESVLTELRQAEADAQLKADKAVTEAEKNAAKREAVQAAQAADQIKAIEQAEANNENALDALF